ncbi:MAG: bifunctional molybdenum cofactor biosynthesis protein MoaC/MoaB [Bradymonadaceae bacterium]
MKDITDKVDSLRIAVAEAYIEVGKELLASVSGGRKTDKGDALEASRVAAIMAAKRTSESLPFCHPIPVTYADVAFDVREAGIHLEVTVKTIASTGVEMEALHAASTCALCLYDMLKPHASSDTGIIEIEHIRLVKKSGGKSDHKPEFSRPQRVGVLVVSDAVAGGHKKDTAGQSVLAALKKYDGLELVDYELLATDYDAVRQTIGAWILAETDLIITVGGTGITAEDRIVETLEPLIDRPLPGIMETARHHGQRRTPKAFLSRGIAGMAGDSLIVTFPGSTGGAAETCDALFPGILHLLEPC